MPRQVNSVTIGFGIVILIVVAWIGASRLLLERDAVTRIDTPAGPIEVGQLWEDVWPQLETGILLESETTSPELGFEVRRFPSGTFQIIYGERTGEKRRITSIRAVAP